MWLKGNPPDFRVISILTFVGVVYGHGVPKEKSTSKSCVEWELFHRITCGKGVMCNSGCLKRIMNLHAKGTEGGRCVLTHHRIKATSITSDRVCTHSLAHMIILQCFRNTVASI